MPVYPCRNCSKSVDPVQDACCKNCGEQMPFSCSKCNTKMGQESIFELAGLKFQKPLFCIPCGEANKVIECRICGKTLIKSNAKVTTTGGIERVYHPDCFQKQIKNTDMIAKFVTPALGVLGAIIGWGYGGWLLVLPGAAAGAMLCLGVARIMAPK